MNNPSKMSRKLHSTIILLCSCCLVLLCSAAPARAVTLPETAKLLPPDTVLLVDIQNLSSLKKQFEQTSFYKIYKDPVMAPFFDNLKTKWREQSRELKSKSLGLLAGIDDLPEGRIALAVVFNEKLKDANDRSFVLIIQWGRNINKIKEMADKKVKQAVEDGDHRKSEGYRGVDITTIIRKSSEVYNFCFIEDCLIAAVDMDVLKFIIAHIKGAGSPTLADDADYSSTMRAVKLPNSEQIDCYVNIKQIIKTAIDSDAARDTASTSRQTFTPKTMIGNLGLDNVTSFGCSIVPRALSTASAGSSFGKAFLKIKGQKKGVTKMLEVESAPLRTPRFIPNSAYSVSFMNLNIKNAYSELGNILSRFSPQFAALMYMPLIPAGPQGEPPMQIKAGIVDHLGSQIIIAQSINDSVSIADRTGPETSLIGIAIENRGALEKSLSLLHGKLLAANNPDATRQFLGHTIYLLDIQGFMPGLMPGAGRPMQNPNRGQIPKMPKYAFTITDTHLIFSKESAVEQALRTLNSAENVSVDSERWFNIAKSSIPSRVGLVTLQNDTVSGKYIWSEMRSMSEQMKSKKSGSEMGVGGRAGSVVPKMMFAQAGLDLFDFGLLPEFDDVKKYFGLSALYGVSKSDGFVFEYKYLNPPDAD
ncbi:MAG: DUF3352 domain-containing protein [Planctomycetes bacterium]|nr:DUF3352 domain-containing protein [Planctomycetota bacterium]